MLQPEGNDVLGGVENLRFPMRYGNARGDFLAMSATSPQRARNNIYALVKPFSLLSLPRHFLDYDCLAVLAIDTRRIPEQKKAEIPRKE